MTPRETVATMRSYLDDITRAIKDAEQVMGEPASFERAMDTVFSEANWLAELAGTWEDIEWDDTFEDLLPT